MTSRVSSRPPSAMVREQKEEKERLKEEEKNRLEEEEKQKEIDRKNALTPSQKFAEKLMAGMKQA